MFFTSAEQKATCILVIGFLSLSTSAFHFKKKCKDLPNGTTGCNPSVLEKLEQMKRDATTDTHATVWKGLDQFKNLGKDDNN
jgi:hypothetical protein